MTTDYRALCAELADAYLRLLEHINNSTWLGYEPSDDQLLVRTRAALSAPEQKVSPQCVADGCLEEAARQEPGSPLQQLLSEAGGLLTRWGRPAVKPVPVSERLPGPEDCDSEGRCWFGTAGSDTMKPHWVYRKAEHCRPWDTHWAPHWALPVPQEGADD